MSAFNNNPNNASLNNNGIDSRTTGITDDRHHIQPTAGQLNENHGIAATGLNEPHTHASIPNTQGTTAERRSDNLNFSGPPIAANKVDQASTQTPSYYNTTAGTGIPPVNTAEHTRQNAAQEALSGHRDNYRNVGTGVGATGTAAAAAGAGRAAADKLSGNHHNATGAGITSGGSGITSDHYNTTSAGLTGNHHNTTGTGITSDHHNTTGTGLKDNHHNTTSTGLTGNHHNTTGTGITSDHYNTTGAGLTGDHHNTTGTRFTGNHDNTTGTGITSDYHNTTGTGLTGNHHNTTGAGLTGDRYNDENLAGASAIKGDHGASHHNQSGHGASHHNQSGHARLDDNTARVGRDVYPAGATAATGAAGAGAGAAGVRHSGEPQHDGLLSKKNHHNNDNAAFSDNHASDGVDGKPSAGDKIKGTLEKIAGKISGSESKVIAGENKAAGRT